MATTTTTTTTDTLKGIYEKQMFYTDVSAGGKKEIASENPNEKNTTRLTKLYFDEGMYDEAASIPTFVPAYIPTIASKFVNNTFRNGIFSSSTQPLSSNLFQNKSKEEIYNIFKTKLESYISGLSTTTTVTPASLPNTTITGTELLDALKVTTYAPKNTLMAWNHIDVMFPETERSEFGFIQRLHTITKFVFMLKVLDPSKVTDTDKKAIALNLCQELLLHLYKDILQFTTLGDGTSGTQIDDVFADNTRLTHEIRNNSKTLIKNKDRVKLTQNNLRSLANLEKHVQKTRNMTWYTMIAILAVLVIGGVSMAYSYARGMTGEVYLLASIIVIGVFSFEAFRGAERIFSLPPSTFE